MEKAKRPCWRKLDNDFFTTNIYTKKLMSMDNGTELVLLWLEILAYSSDDYGVLTFQGVEANLAEELALILDEDTELMCRLIDFLTKNELLVDQGNNTFKLEEVLEIWREGFYQNISRGAENHGN